MAKFNPRPRRRESSLVIVARSETPNIHSTAESPTPGCRMLLRVARRPDRPRKKLGSRCSTGLRSSCFQVFLQHLAAISNGKITTLPLPRPYLGLSFPGSVLIQFVIRFFVRSIDDVFVAHVQRTLLKDVKEFQAALSRITAGQTQIHSMSVGLTLFLWPVEPALQGMEEQCEQCSSGKARDGIGPTLEERNVAKVMVRNFMTDNEGDLLVRWAELVEASGEVDVAPRCSKSCGFLKPRNLDHQAVRLRPTGL
jgi:hypothetical protein